MTVHKPEPAATSTSNGSSPAEEQKRSNGTDSKQHGHPPSSFGLPPADYTYKQLHDDLEHERFIGTFGADNSIFIALAGIRAGIDMSAFHTKRSPSEFFVPEMHELLQHEHTQRHWNKLVTFDPLGMYSKRPTISATTARMEIPEIANLIEPDEAPSNNPATGNVSGGATSNSNAGPVIVNADRSINCIKIAIDYAFNLPGLAARLEMNEQEMRQALAKCTAQPDVTDTSRRCYLPPARGISIYIIGDPSKLSNPSTEVAYRPHDACCGSDVFGTDICTCRPYLVYAIQGAVECAKRGGVGIIAYYHKEGRSLGEVTKFRVYNARKGQSGGDTAANYFKMTEEIAGIRDARFQAMAPDVLLWLGVDRIDWLLSMSSDKYDALTAAGVHVMQRQSLPDDLVPAGATVEITAKISSGYHAESFQAEDVIDHLRSLETIRERTGQIYALALANKTRYFTLHEEQLDAVADYVIAVGKRDYPDLTQIPYHSRWRHFNQHALQRLESKWKCSPEERCRRQLDLACISVLLDAGAGNKYKYTDADGITTDRSEALALASFDMFKYGFFSSDIALPNRVNATGLKALTFAKLAQGFKVSEHNYLVGLHGRFELLQRLGDALRANPQYFGQELYRPGNVLDYLLQHAKVNDSDGKKHVSLKYLWEAVIVGFEQIWPKSRSGVKRGDCWAYSALKKPQVAASDFVPFHKLSQWLTYSLLEPIEKYGLVLDDMHLMTGLAEYRNGGLMVDLGVLEPKDSKYRSMEWDVGSELIVEWRALTLILLDKVAERIRRKLNFSEAEFPLAKVLQMGTWTAGRQIAQEKRGDRSSPINIRSDGTVF